MKKNKSSNPKAPMSEPSEVIKISKKEIEARVYYNVDDIQDEWDAVVPDDLFARSEYLMTLQNTNPRELSHMYVLIYKRGILSGGLLLQHLLLRPAESFDYDSYTTNKSWISRIWQSFRQVAVSWLRFRLLTVGNLYLTGQYGIHFNQEIMPAKRYELVNEIISKLRSRLRVSKFRFNGVLYKDFFEDSCIDRPEQKGLYPFTIDPNMILTIKPSWQSFDDYLLDMKSKYRVRQKNALKKGAPLERRILSHEEVMLHCDRMYDLYSSVLDRSGFVLAMGRKDYFKELKIFFGDRLTVVGYFLDDDLVAFYTWIMDGGKMDSHFIGFREEMNGPYQIYLNILLDLVRDGIDQKAQSLYYFRTALEIKSSVGAEPHDMYCYFKHMWPLVNKIVPTAFKYFVPQQNWKQRHPFKTSV